MNSIRSILKSSLSMLLLFAPSLLLCANRTEVLFPNDGKEVRLVIEQGDITKQQAHVIVDCYSQPSNLKAPNVGEFVEYSFPIQNGWNLRHKFFALAPDKSIRNADEILSNLYKTIYDNASIKAMRHHNERWQIACGSLRLSAPQGKQLGIGIAAEIALRAVINQILMHPRHISQFKFVLATQEEYLAYKKVLSAIDIQSSSTQIARIKAQQMEELRHTHVMRNGAWVPKTKASQSGPQKRVGFKEQRVRQFDSNGTQASVVSSLSSRSSDGQMIRAELPKNNAARKPVVKQATGWFSWENIALAAAAVFAVTAYFKR